MKVKRPSKIVLSALILGIITAYSNINLSLKLILVAISFFLLCKYYSDNKINIKVAFVVFLVFVLGVCRFTFEENYFDNINNYIENNKNIVYTGKIINIGESTNSYYYDLKNITLDNNKPVNKARVYFNKDMEIIYDIGNIVEVESKIYTIDPPMNYGEFNSLNYYRSIDVAFTSYLKGITLIDEEKDVIRSAIYDVKNKIKENIFKIFNEEDAGVVLLMLTGDKSKIDKSIKKLFSDNGISHILAISGLHLSILGLMLFELLRKKFSIKKSALAVSIFIFLYGIMIDASATSLRAILMLYIRFFSLYLGRSYDSKNTLYILCILSLLIRPYLLFNAGFLFSYVAVFALNLDYIIYDSNINEKEVNDKLDLINKEIDSSKKVEIIEKKRVYIKVPSIVMLTLFIFPITIYNYFDYPTYSILLNLIVIPLMTFVLLFSVIGVMVSFLNIYIARFVVGIVHYILVLYKMLCEIVLKLPCNSINFGKPNQFVVFIFYLTLALIYIYLKKKNDIDKDTLYDDIKKERYKIIFKKSILSVIGIIFIIVLSFIHIKYDYKMSFISVGQGDGIIIQNKDNIISIDGGSSSNNSLNEYILTPNLKSRQINTINHAFITHADSDHVNGIYDMLNADEIIIENIYMPIFAKENLKYKNIIDLSESKNVKINYLKSGDKLVLGDVDIELYNPIYSDLEEKNDINEQSLCFIMKYKDLKTMITGDIGKSTEEKILRNIINKKELDCDILKVAHHGSRSSSLDDFIKYTSPEISIISCGRNNQYNHPHKETIRTLEKYNTKIYMTPKNGEIDIIYKDDKIKIEKYIN